MVIIFNIIFIPSYKKHAYDLIFPLTSSSISGTILLQRYGLKQRERVDRQSLYTQSQFVKKDQLNHQMDQLNKYIQPLQFKALDNMASLKMIEEKTKLKPSVLLLIVFAILLILSPILKTYVILTSLVCYLIPAYLSFLALESTDKEDDIRYLTYWIIFSLGEVTTPFLKMFFNKFTYMTFRIALTLVLLHPESGVASLIYNKAVKPFLSENEKAIDEKIDEYTEKGKKKIVEGVQEGLKHL